MERKAEILRIEKISPNDGNGLRTVIFFKGCSLRCRWCSTPESQKMGKELYYQSGKCILCGKCVEICASDALFLDMKSRKLIFDEMKCKGCFQCVEACNVGARGIYGKYMTVQEIMKSIRKDEIFYYHSGGGVTLSGGDVLCQAEFARDLLRACRDSGIHTMAELDMYGSYKNVEMILPYLDEFYVDIKLMDGELHKKWTGRDNTSILENTKKAALACRENTIHIRVPLVWNVNDSYENIASTADFCRNLFSCRELEFLPYHRLGQAAYGYLGRDYALGNLPAMTYDQAYEKVKFLREENLPFPVKISGKEI